MTFNDVMVGSLTDEGHCGFKYDMLNIMALLLECLTADCLLVAIFTKETNSIQ
jgi:hypothetical protein